MHRNITKFIVLPLVTFIFCFQIPLFSYFLFFKTPTRDYFENIFQNFAVVNNRVFLRSSVNSNISQNKPTSLKASNDYQIGESLYSTGVVMAGKFYTDTDDEIAENYFQDRKVLKTAPEKVFDLQPIKFIPTLKNPCFFVEASANETRLKGNMTLKCLPYAFLFGTEKCGTSDLYRKLVLHQHLHGSVLKETQFFTNMMQSQKRNFHNGTINGYINMFQESIDKIIRDCHWQFQTNVSNNTKCPHILIDATPRYFHNSKGVWNDPLNIGLKEPNILVPHRIKHLLPDAKLILMLRNPTDRIFSAYKYFNNMGNRTSSMKDFHEYVINATQFWNVCQNHTSERNCAYNFNIGDIGGIRKSPSMYRAYLQIKVGMYDIFLKDCLSVFSRNNILIIKFEDYVQNETAFMEKVLKFLDLEPFSFEVEKLLHQYSERDQVFNKGWMGPTNMWPITRDLLDRFYKKHNLQVAEILNDPHFSWENDEHVIQRD